MNSFLKKIFVTFIVYIGYTISNAEIWTLKESIERAIKVNPEAMIAQASIDRALAISEQADSTLYPKLAANLGYSQTNNPMMSFGNILNQGTFDNSINFNNPGRTDAFLAGIYLKYPIFSGGSNIAQRKSAQNLSDANSLERDVVYNNLRIETIRSYFAIIQSQLLEKSISETIASLEQNLKNAKNLEDAGRLLKSERLSIEIQLLNAKESLLAVSQQLELSKRRFANVLDLSEIKDIQVDEKDIFSNIFNLPKDVQEKIRPEILALQKRIDSAGNNVDVQIGMYFPTVSLVGGYQYDKGWVRSGDNGSWTAGVMVEVPIFDGMLTRGKVREAKAYEIQARQELRKLENSLNFEKQRAMLAYNLILEQEKLISLQLTQSQETLNLINERFKSGLVLSVELLKAESSLIEAKIKLNILKSSKAISLAELRRALGLEIFER